MNAEEFTAKAEKNKKHKKKKAVDSVFEKLLGSQFTRIPRGFLLCWTWVSRYLRRYDDAVLKAIVNATYGFNKHKGWASLGLISRMTNLQDKYVCRSLDKLELYRMIHRTNDKKDHNHIIVRIETDYRKWRIETKDGHIDLADVKERKLYPSPAERAWYKMLDMLIELDEEVENVVEIDE